MSEKSRPTKNRKKNGISTDPGTSRDSVGEEKWRKFPVLVNLIPKPQRKTIQKRNEARKKLDENRIVIQRLLTDIQKNEKSAKGGGKSGNVEPNGRRGPAGSSKNGFSEEREEIMDFSGLRSFTKVCKLAGVELEKERQVGTEKIGTIIRSCGDSYLLNLKVLMKKITEFCIAHSLRPKKDVAELISHAVEDRLKNIVENAFIIAKWKKEKQLPAPIEDESPEEETPEILRLEDLQAYMEKDPILKHGKILCKSYLIE